MICMLIKRVEEGYEVDGEFMGYGNRNIIEAFAMEGIDLKKEMNDMKIGEVKVWNIGWYPNDRIHRRYLPGELSTC